MDTIKKVERMVDGESYNRTSSYDEKNDIVWLTQSTQLDTGDHAYNVHFRYGMLMKNIELDALKVNAAQNIHIKVMRTRCFKKAKDEKAIEAMALVLDPMDYPSTGGVGITAKERDIRFMVDKMGLSREQAEHFADNEDELKVAWKMVSNEEE